MLCRPMQIISTATSARGLARRGQHLIYDAGSTLERQATAGASMLQGRSRFSTELSKEIPQEIDSSAEEQPQGEPVRKLPTLRAQTRTERELGSRGSRRCRNEGTTPGVLYATGEGDPSGRGSREMVKVDTKEVNAQIRRLQSSFESTVYELIVERTQEQVDELNSKMDATVSFGMESGRAMREYRERVLPVQVGLHAVSNRLLQANYIRFKPGRKLSVPIRFINDDLNLNFKKGAMLMRMKTHQVIHLPSDPFDVPPWLDLDMETVTSGMKLRVSDLIIPPGIKLHKGDIPATWNEVVASVKGKKLWLGDEEEDEKA